MGGPHPEQSPPTSYTCQSISEQMSANESVLKQLFVIEAAAAEIRKTLGLAELVPAAAGQSSGKSKKSEPKEKRPPSAWVVFSSQRVGSLVRKAEEGQEKKSPVGVVNQFAGHLWGQKKEWTDEEILAAWPTFTPPEVSKQALKKSESVSGDEAEKKTGKGSRGPQSEEVKAAARLKRAANKAKKEAESASQASASQAAESSDEETAADTFEEAEAEPEPVKPVEAPKPKPAEAKPKAEPKVEAKPEPKAESKPATKAGKKSIKKEWTKEELYCDEWEHDGDNYFKNERGDVLTTDGHWVGRWDGKKLDTNAAKPEDFSKIDVRPA